LSAINSKINRPQTTSTSPKDTTFTLGIPDIPHSSSETYDLVSSDDYLDDQHRRQSYLEQMSDDSQDKDDSWQTFQLLREVEQRKIHYLQAEQVLRRAEDQSSGLTLAISDGYDDFKDDGL